MHLIDTPTATRDGHFTEGDPLIPLPATVVSADWLNSIQDELAAIITAAGLDLKKTETNQVLQALNILLTKATEGSTLHQKLMVGCPVYWTSTTLPPDYAWPDRSLILFEDRPWLKWKYDQGYFNGMLLEATATTEEKNANLGKWVKHPNGVGLYTPDLGDQFFRAWEPGGGRQAGSWQEDTVQTGITKISATRFSTAWNTVTTAEGNIQSYGTQTNVDTLEANTEVKRDWQIFESLQRFASETQPVNIAIPTVIYLGLPI